MCNYKKCEKLSTFALFSYNQDKFVKEALEGAFSQTYSPLEIIISDDFSIDKTWEVIQARVEKNSNNSVTTNQNKTNQGINAHVNTLIKLSSGQFIMIASGDDISMSNRVDKLVEKWQTGAIGVFSNAEIIDAHGNVKGLFMHEGYQHLSTWKEMVVAGRHGSWGCSFAWDKKIFDVFGLLPLNILGEDAVIPFRCALLGTVAYIDEPLVQYRDHGSNVSFWAQIKNKKKQSLLDIGKKIIHFDQVLYQNWRKDIVTAESAGYLTRKEVIWAESWLSVHEEIRDAQLNILQRSFIASMLQLVRTLWMKRKGKHRGLWGKRLVGMFLQFRLPSLYKLLLYLKGVNRV